MLSLTLASVAVTTPSGAEEAAVVGETPELLTDEGCPVVEPAVLRSDIPSYCESHYDPVDAELRRIEADLGGLASFAHRAAEAFGERYGGKWRDTVGSGPGIAVGLVNPTEADRVTLRELSGSDRAGLFRVRYSEAQLQRWGSEVVAVLARHGVKGLGGDIDAPRSTVRFLIDTLPESAAAEIAHLEGVPAEAVSIKTGYRLELNHSSRQSTAYPHEAGLQVVVGQRNLPVGINFGHCTSGFNTFNAAGYFATTAGHCTVHGSSVHRGSAVIGCGAPSVCRYQGDIDVNTYPPPGGTSPTDAARYPIVAAEAMAHIYTGQSSSTSTNDPNAHRPVTDQFAYGEFVKAENGNPATVLCFQGITSDNDNCGPVVWIDPRPVEGGRTLTSFVCIETGPKNTSQLGDSGGPVYGVNYDNRAAKAAGIIHGNLAHEGSTVPTMTCFTSIDAVLSGLGVKLLVAPMLTPAHQSGITGDWFTYFMSVAQEPDRATTLRFDYGDGRHQTWNIPQGSAKTSVSHGVQFTNAGTYTQQATIVETGASTTSRTGVVSPPSTGGAGVGIMQGVLTVTGNAGGTVKSIGKNTGNSGCLDSGVAKVIKATPAWTIRTDPYTGTPACGGASSNQLNNDTYNVIMYNNEDRTVLGSTMYGYSGTGSSRQWSTACGTPKSITGGHGTKMGTVTTSSGLITTASASAGYTVSAVTSNNVTFTKHTALANSASQPNESAICICDTGHNQGNGAPFSVT